MKKHIENTYIPTRKDILDLIGASEDFCYVADCIQEMFENYKGGMIDLPTSREEFLEVGSDVIPELLDAMYNEGEEEYGIVMNALGEDYKWDPLEDTPWRRHQEKNEPSRRRMRESVYHPTKEDILDLFKQEGGDSDFVEEAVDVLADIYKRDYTEYNAYGPFHSREEFLKNGYEDIHEIVNQDPHIYEEDADLVYLAFGEDYYDSENQWTHEDYEAEEADRQISEFHDMHGHYDV